MVQSTVGFVWFCLPLYSCAFVLVKMFNRNQYSCLKKYLQHFRNNQHSRYVLASHTFLMFTLIFAAYVFL
jgi:hypothetical protein